MRALLTFDVYRSRSGRWSNPVARFWAKVDVRPEGCWLYRGKIEVQTGYGRFTVGYESYGAHRFAWLITNGPIAKGLHILHRCDNPPCVRPDHLFLGTNADNVRDKLAKGRDFSLYRGATHCVNGHEYTPENTYRDKEGDRHCRACHREWSRRARAGRSA